MKPRAGSHTISPARRCTQLTVRSARTSRWSLQATLDHLVHPLLGQSWKGPSRKRIGEKWLGTDDTTRNERTDGRRTEHVVYSNPILRHTTTSHPPFPLALPPRSRTLAAFSAPRFTLDSPLHRFTYLLLVLVHLALHSPVSTPSLLLSLLLLPAVPKPPLPVSRRPLFPPVHRETSEAINPPSYNVLTTFRETSTGTRG